MGQMTQKGSQGWMREEPTKGFTPILEGLQGLKERRKSD